MKKLTTEEFIRRAKERHGDKYDYSLTEYTKSSAKVKIICPVHGVFEQVASSHMMGFGCQKCGATETWKKRERLTTEEFIAKSREIHGDKYDYSKTVYEGSHKNVCIICPIHGEFWQNPHVHLRGQGCDKCGDIIISEKLSMGKEEFIRRATEKHNGKYKYPEYIEYKNNVTKVPIICSVHGEFWQAPANHLKGAGCPKCALEGLKKPKVSKEEFIRKSMDVHYGKYCYSDVLYRGMHTKVKIICPKHGEFWQLPANHVIGQGCPKCGDESTATKKMMTGEEFIIRCRDAHNGKYTYNKLSYKGISHDIIVTCPKHGDFCINAAAHLYSKHGCPKCSNQISKGENEIFKLIKKIDNDCKQRVKSIIKPYEIDIYAPSYKIGIEYDGLLWHSDFYGKDESYHLSKTEKCLENGIRLIHIFEDEWAEKKEIVESRLNSLFGVYQSRIYARQCEVKCLDSKTASIFLKNNHLQGNVSSPIRYGLYYKGELVAVMTFGKLRKNLGSKSRDGEYEMLRFCTKLNTAIVGGASKLLKRFIRDYNPIRVLSYADRRWSDGNLYVKLGFKHIRNSRPGYFYLINRKRENRFKYRKSELVKQGFDKDKSEHEIMRERGIPRIYDCGNMVFELRF